jgi:Glyoxalase/Bleomycin resistance protein/Dioxygenase superfamily
MLSVPRYEVIQNAYVVNDLDEAMQGFHERAGYGPWMTLREVPLTRVLYRGAPAELNLACAFTQAGDIQIELIQQLDDRPSALRDLYPKGRQGFHHTTFRTAAFQETIDAYEEAGLPCVQLMDQPDGKGMAFIDASPLLGHMIEVYEDSDTIRGFYALVRGFCEEWDGTRLVHGLEELM